MTTSSIINTCWPGASLNPRRSSKTPSGRSRNIASTPSARAISCPAITPPIAGETTAEDARLYLGGQLLDQALRKPRAARRIHQHARALQVTRAPETRGKDEMPLEQRVGSAEFGKDVVVGHRLRPERVNPSC